MKSLLKKIAKIFLKPGTRRFALARKVAQKSGILQPLPRDIRYQEWVERTEAFTWSEFKPLLFRPKISIVVPVFNPPAEDFLPMVYSVVGQSYDNWELLLVNASNQHFARKLNTSLHRYRYKN